MRWQRLTCIQPWTAAVATTMDAWPHSANWSEASAAQLEAAEDPMDHPELSHQCEGASWPKMQIEMGLIALLCGAMPCLDTT